MRVVPAPGVYDDGEFGGTIDRGNRSTRRKPTPVPFCPHKPHKPTTNRLSYGKAKKERKRERKKEKKKERRWLCVPLYHYLKEVPSIDPCAVIKCENTDDRMGTIKYTLETFCKNIHARKS
jgi:hypothetical protein